MSYAAFFLNSPSRVAQLELMEVSHSAFTQTRRIVRNAVGGVTVNLGGLDGSQAFSYYPLRIRPTGSRDNLDQSIRVDLGDLGEVLPTELDAVSDADGWSEKPRVRYWTFRSDDLTAPLFGPISFEVINFSFTREGASFEAQAPALNINRTGELYSLPRFPMLRGLL
jgi:hypothetical protein